MKAIADRRRWAARTFLGGQAVSLLGDSFAVLAIPLLVLEFSRNPVVSALSAASVTVGYLFVGLPAGVLVDRFDPWRTLMLMDAARAVLFLSLYSLGVADLLSVGVILAIAFLAGICHVFFETALVVVVKDLFTGPGLIKANSGIEVATQLSLVLGPAAVGGLVALGNLNLALLVNALTFLASLASLTTVWRKRPRNGRPDTALRLRAMFSEFRAGLHYLRSVRVLIVMTAVQMIVNLSLAVEKLIFFFARNTLGLTPTLTSAVVAAGGIGGMIGALTSSWLVARAGEMRLVAITIALAGGAIVAMSMAGSFAALALTNLAYGWALIVASLVNRTFRQRLVPRELLGRVTSTVRMLFLAVEPAGVIIAGALTAWLGGDPRLVFLGAGLLVVAAAIGGWLAGLATHHRAEQQMDRVG
jgi:predicted MFS family arabinose efflux permease